MILTRRVLLSALIAPVLFGAGRVPYRSLAGERYLELDDTCLPTLEELEEALRDG